MTKQPINSSQMNSRGFFESWMDQPWAEWLSAYKQYFIWGGFALLALLILAYRLLATQTLHAEKDFFQAQTDFLQLQQMTPSTQDANAEASLLQSLEAIMVRRPELHAKYDGALAQTMLIENNLPQAKSFAQSTFQRTRPDGLNLYQDYAKVSLLIGEGLYAEALTQTQQLKEKMDQSEKQAAFGQTLYTFNLIRLAMLYQQLNQSQEEKAVWDNLLSKAENNLAAYQLFKTGQTSLTQYINERKQALSH